LQLTKEPLTLKFQRTKKHILICLVMKSKKDFRKPVKNDSFDSDELKRAKKLKPVKKEKNLKRSFYEEIDEFEDLDDLDLKDSLEDYYDDAYEEEEDDF